MNLLPAETHAFLTSWGEGGACAAVILGSGWGGASTAFPVVRSVAYAEIPGAPRPTVPGHAGRLVLVQAGRRPVVLFCGRLHVYEGLALEDVVFPVVAARALGAETLVVTNAAGGIHPALRPGSLLLVRDQINLLGDSPLKGLGARDPSLRFQSMDEAYSPRLRSAARRILADRGLDFLEGVLAAVPGPSYETPAEVRMLGRLGADAVCMSTIPEVITARALGIEVLGLSLITNRAAGCGGRALRHADVLQRAQQEETRLRVLLEALVSWVVG